MLLAHFGTWLTMIARAVDGPLLLSCIFLVLLQVAVSNGYCSLKSWLWPNNGGDRNEAFAVSTMIERAGHAVQFLLDTEKFLRKLLLMHVDAIIPLKFPGRSIYFAMPGNQVLYLFRNSRSVLPFPSVFDAMSTLFGLPQADVHIFKTASTSQEGYDIHRNDVSRSIMMSQRKDMVLYLTGGNLNTFMQKFTCRLVKKIRQDAKNIWYSRPDLYRYMTRQIFLAEVEVLYGEDIFRVCPTLCEDFWLFYEAIPTLSRKPPTWYSPSSYATQRRMLDNFKRWQSSCLAQSNEEKTGVDTMDTEPVWGTHYIRRMYERFRDLGFSEDGIASAMVGFLFLTVANSIPASVWMMLHIFLDGDLRDRVEAETSEAFTGTVDVVQTDQLIRAPLLNSICNEVLRLHVGSPFGRTSQSTLELPGGCKVLPGIPVMSVNWLGGLDRHFWNTGKILSNKSDEHPLEGFWAERFLAYDGDTTSGPVRKEGLQEQRKISTQKEESLDRKPKLVTTGLQSHWFPFGGGAYRCPGEALGKQAMLVSVAAVLHELQIELQNPAEAAATRSKHRTLPFGSHSFDRDIPFRICGKDAITRELASVHSYIVSVQPHEAEEKMQLTRVALPKLTNVRKARHCTDPYNFIHPAGGVAEQRGVTEVAIVRDGPTAFI